MGDSFYQTKQVEAAGAELFELWLNRCRVEWLPVHYSTPSTKAMQYSGIDYIVNVGPKSMTVDLKVEQANLHGNFFFETWSNLSVSRPGWLWHDPPVDRLCYVFLNDRQLYWIDFPQLQEWLRHPDTQRNFSEKPQAKYDQHNDTWGLCVPIVSLKESPVTVVDWKEKEVQG